MYGFTPRAMIENDARPPPENRSSSWRKALCPEDLGQRLRVDARNGHVRERAHDDQHPQDEQDPAPDVRRAEGVDEGVEHRVSGLGGGVGGVGVNLGGCVRRLGRRGSGLRGSGLRGPRARTPRGCGGRRRLRGRCRGGSSCLWCRGDGLDRPAGRLDLAPGARGERVGEPRTGTRDTSPAPRILTGCRSRVMSPAARRTSGLTVRASAP